MRFIGNIEAKTDTKGRVFLPSVFRKELQTVGEQTMVLRKDVFQQCLVLYPESVWNQQMDALRQRLNRWNPQHQQLYRTFVSDAEVVALDGSGRLLIPRRYLDLAGIQQQVKFIGMGDSIEIWSTELTQQPFMEAEQFGQELSAIMAGANEDINASV